MARDRKRAKQRQRKRSGRQQQQQPQQPQQPRQQQQPQQPRESQPTPVSRPGSVDALGQAAPDVELAELAAEAGLQEPGAPVGHPLDDKDYPHLDELEGADVIEETEEEEAADRAGGRPRRRAAAGRELPKEGNRFINFLRACVAELRRVQWPDRKQVGQATAVVIGFVVVAGSYLGLLDAVFSRLVNAIL
jgi:preprotein translocase SecE subunit